MNTRRHTHFRRIAAFRQADRFKQSDLVSGSAMERSFRICAPIVVGEVIDGEAVIMNLRSGHYFSATGAGALIWQGLEEGRNYRQIILSLAVRYKIGADPLRDAVDTFLAQLLENDLIEEFTFDETLGNGAAAEEIGIATPIADFDPPVLSIHTDLQDLLLLDPVHDTDAAGWPTRKA